MAAIINKTRNKIYQTRYRRSQKGRRSKRNAAYKTLYGITIDQYESILQIQQGKCALCHQHRPLQVDHDHITKIVRGLLCRPCNVALGTLGDNKEGLLRALAYLNE